MVSLHDKAIYFPYWHLEEDAWFPLTFDAPAPFERGFSQSWIHHLPHLVFYHPVSVVERIPTLSKNENKSENLLLIIHFSSPPRPGVLPFLLECYQPYFPSISYTSSQRAMDEHSIPFFFAHKKVGVEV